MIIGKRLLLSRNVSYSGAGIIKVDKIGNETEYGKIGYNISKVKQNRTILQKQTDKLVKVCAIIAFGLFILVGLLLF